MAFISSGALIRSRQERDDHIVITERHEGQNDEVVVWDSRSGLPDPDPYEEPWWKEFDTPDGYSKMNPTTFGSRQRHVLGQGLVTEWDSRVDGIPKEWREEERKRREKYERIMGISSKHQSQENFAANIIAITKNALANIFRNLALKFKPREIVVPTILDDGNHKYASIMPENHRIQAMDQALIKSSTMEYGTILKQSDGCMSCMIGVCNDCKASFSSAAREEESHPAGKGAESKLELTPSNVLKNDWDIK